MAAAGYDVIIVETVGVGQSESLVAEMTDCFLLLALARSGDQLQGIKKGVLELADVVAVNKADGSYETEARRAARELSGALRLIESEESEQTPVLTCSALEGTGLDEVWRSLSNLIEARRANGEFDRRRQAQRVTWMWALVRDEMLSRLRDDQRVNALADELEHEVRDGSLTPGFAANRLVQTFIDTQGSLATG
jgi:LAO/AO transport system kinase